MVLTREQKSVPDPDFEMRGEWGRSSRPLERGGLSLV